MNNTKKICPACGFELDYYPWVEESPSDEICPSCGIQFGYTDFAGGDVEKRRQLYENWRKEWIQNGMKWWSIDNPLRQPPLNWNPHKQLKNIPKEFLGPDEHY